jgi:hypothetical protein
MRVEFVIVQVLVESAPQKNISNDEPDKPGYPVHEVTPAEKLLPFQLLDDAESRGIPPPTPSILNNSSLVVTPSPS